MSKISAESGHKHGKQFWLVYNRLFKSNTCEKGPIKDFKGNLPREQKETAEQLKQTLFEAAHLKNHRFDEDHRQKMENYLQTEVRIPLQEGTLDIWQER